MSANLYPLAEANTFHIGEKFGVGTLNGNVWRVRRTMALLAGEHFFLLPSCGYNMLLHTTQNAIGLLTSCHFYWENVGVTAKVTERVSGKKKQQFYINVCTKMPSMVYLLLTLQKAH